LRFRIGDRKQMQKRKMEYQVGGGSERDGPEDEDDLGGFGS
jgi:hypothetical protein